MMETRARSLTGLFFAVLVCIASVPTAASPGLLEAESALPESLGVGSVTITTKQLGLNDFLLALEIDLNDIVATIVSVPGEATPLLSIELEAYSAMVEALTGREPASARMRIGSDELNGHLEHHLVFDGRQLETLVVTLVTRDGDVHPMTFRGKSFADGQAHKVELRGTRCYTVYYSCTQPNGHSCSTSQECCSQRIDACADCNGCTITCPPCSMLPN